MTDATDVPGAAPHPPRVLIADDHQLLCEGLCGMLAPEYGVAGSVHDGREVAAQVLRLAPDAVLLDVGLPGRSGLEVARELGRLAAPPAIVMLTMHADRVYADEATRLGARGYVLKVATSDELKLALDTALAGGTYVTPLVRRHIARVEATPMCPGADGSGSRVGSAAACASDGAELLTPRQLEVLGLVVQGRTNGEIAERLAIGIKAVEFHRMRIKRTLGLQSNAALVRFAVARGLAEG